MRCRGEKEKGLEFSSPVVGNGPVAGQALIPSRRDPERGRQEEKGEEGGGEIRSSRGERNKVVKLLLE